MEKQTVTIEMDRWVASVLLWSAGGAVIAFIVFLATFDPIDHWTPIISTSVVVMAYLVLVFLYAVRPPVSFRVAVGTLVLVTAAAGGYLKSVDLIYADSQGRSSDLLLLRADISRDILTGMVTDTLLVVLREYYAMPHDAYRSIGKVFRDRYPEAKVGANMRRPLWSADFSQMIPTEISDTMVELVGVDPVAPGWVSDFKNVGGSKGGVQFLARLTPEGLEYGFQN